MEKKRYKNTPYFIEQYFTDELMAVMATSWYMRLEQMEFENLEGLSKKCTCMDHCDLGGPGPCTCGKIKD